MDVAKRSQSQIDEVVNDAYENIDAGGSRWPGMSYEQGVAAALEWVTGASEEPPFEEN